MTNIPYVNEGDPIYAKTINSIIEATNLMERDYSCIYKQYDRGTVRFYNNEQTNGGSFDDDSLYPFSVMSVSNQEYDFSGYAIYLPPGCVTYGATHQVLNDNLKDLSGNIVNNWYKLVKSSDIEKNKSYNVDINVKPYSYLENVDEYTDVPKRYYLANCYDNSLTGDAKLEKTKDWGDSYTQTVGNITYLSTTSEFEYVHSVKNAIAVGDTSVTNVPQFQLVWGFKRDNGDLTVDKYYIKNQCTSAGGSPIVGEKFTRITYNDNIAYIVVKIQSSVTPYEVSIICYTDQEFNSEAIQQSMQQDEGIIYIAVYNLNKGRVVADLRDNLKNIQVYT